MADELFNNLLKLIECKKEGYFNDGEYEVLKHRLLFSDRKIIDEIRIPQSKPGEVEVGETTSPADRRSPQNVHRGSLRTSTSTEKVAQFNVTTGCLDEVTAAQFLSKSGGNMEGAVNSYLTGAAAWASGDAFASAPPPDP